MALVQGRPEPPPPPGYNYSPPQQLPPQQHNHHQFALPQPLQQQQQQLPRPFVSNTGFSSGAATPGYQQYQQPQYQYQPQQQIHYQQPQQQTGYAGSNSGYSTAGQVGQNFGFAGNNYQSLVGQQQQSGLFTSGSSNQLSFGGSSASSSSSAGAFVSGECSSLFFCVLDFNFHKYDKSAGRRFPNNRIRSIDRLGNGISLVPLIHPRMITKFNLDFPAPQQTLIQKHIYVHVPPPETEEVRPQQQLTSAGVAQKHYKIIFIKAPSAPAPSQAQIAAAAAQTQEKTIVYVLVKKPEDQATIVQQQQQAISQPSKPEVYFIKYKTQHGNSGASSSGDGISVGSQQQQQVSSGGSGFGGSLVSSSSSSSSTVTSSGSGYAGPVVSGPNVNNGHTVSGGSASSAVIGIGGGVSGKSSAIFYCAHYNWIHLVS